MSTKNKVTRNQAAKRLNESIRKSKLELWQLRQLLGLCFRPRTDKPHQFVDKIFLPNSINDILQLVKKVEFFEEE